MAYRDRPEGLLAVAPRPSWKLDRIPLDGDPLLVVACEIEKPGNLGTILRSSDAVGAAGVIVCDRCTDVFNPNVVRASIGTLFTVPVVEETSGRVFPWLEKHGIRTVATSPEADLVYSEVDYRGPTAVVIGSEQYGLDSRWLRQTDLTVRIPMAGPVDSLNVAMATTVLLFEAVRQRGIGGQAP
jgi:TrmH family RNA methyltransferase